MQPQKKTRGASSAADPSKTLAMNLKAAGGAFLLFSQPLYPKVIGGLKKTLYSLLSNTIQTVHDSEASR